MALRMVCHYHGLPVSWQEVREACGVPYGDLSLLALSRGAARLGFEALPLAIPLTEIGPHVGLPLIVHVHQGHYVVLYGVRGRDLLIADPARGRLRLSREHFAKEWLNSESLQALRLEKPPGGIPGSGRSIPVYDEPREGFFTDWKPAHWLWLLLEGVTLWLLLAWAGTLFASVQPGQDSLWRPLAVSVLLGLSWAALLGQWRAHRQAFLRIFLDSHNPVCPSFRTAQGTDHVVAALFDIPWHGRRALRRVQGPRALFLFLLCLLFLAVYGSSLALVGLGAAFFLAVRQAMDRGRGMFRIISSTDRRRRHFQSMVLSSTSPGEGPLSQVVPGVRGGIGYPGVVLVLALAIALVVARNAGLSPDGVLVLIPVLAGSMYCFGRFLDARFALALSDYRALRPPSLSDQGEAALPAGSGELYYRADSEGEREVHIPPGASVLLLLTEPGQGRYLLERLSAMAVDEGGELAYHGIPLDKSNRHALQERMIVVGASGSVTLGVSDSGPREVSEQAFRNAYEALFPGMSGSGPELSGMKAGTQPLVLAVAVDPELLLVDECTRGMDPFRELILLENLLSRRKGRTTLIATTREELIPSVDMVLRPDGAPYSASTTMNP